MARVDHLMPERPDNHLCPITAKAMLDPVMDARGHTYERGAIENWLHVRGKNTDPRTNKPLLSKKLTSNHLVSSMIQEWEQTEHDKCMARMLPGRDGSRARTAPCPADVDRGPATRLKLDQVTCADQSKLLKAAHDAMDERMPLRIISRLRYANTPEGWKLGHQHGAGSHQKSRRKRLSRE